ncbi:hypothetical protein ONZ51_g11287 [Trametes cubensis]|uniref:Uncharacterized protein n=1 Tax=Trametes cubensis TaxID=1111947 RepID=A0AAD7TKI6_9APHY|nr:hypothetical protein ONZ51_g11287 [Trametes cubensis]
MSLRDDRSDSPPYCYDDGQAHTATDLEDASVDELNTPQVHTSFQSAFQNTNTSLEIRRLNRMISKLRDLFRKLSIDFAGHDEELQRLAIKSKRKNRGGTPLLRPRWDNLYDRFRTLLDDSHKNATTASAALRMYLVVFTDETIRSGEYDDIKAEVNNLITTANTGIDSARSFEDNFSKLARDIKAFEDDIRDTIATVQTHGSTVEERLDSTRLRVKELRVCLDGATSKTQMTKEGFACIKCLLIGGLSAAAFLLQVSPDATTAVMHTLAAIYHGVQFVEMLKEVRELKKQIREENKIITNLEKEYEATICLEGSLKRSVETLDRIASKVDAFSGIWHIIKTDMSELRSELASVASTHVPEAVQLLTLKLVITRCVYSKLLQALDEYVRGTIGCEKESDDDNLV